MNVTDGGWTVNIESDDLETNQNNMANGESITNMENQIELKCSNQTMDKKLGNDLMFNLTLLNDTNIIDYRIDDCWATPDNNIANPIQFQLSDNGCAQQTWIDTDKRSINFQLFAFRHAAEFYLHCGVLFCELGSTECDARNDCSSLRRKRSALVRYQLSIEVMYLSASKMKTCVMIIILVIKHFDLNLTTKSSQ